MIRNLMKKTAILLLAMILLSGCVWVKTRRMLRREEVVTVATYSIEVMVNKPVEEVYDYLTSWPNIDEIMTFMEFDIPADPRIRKIGDCAQSRSEMMGVHLQHQIVVAELEQNQKLRLALAGDLRGSMLLCLKPEGNRTRLTVNNHLFMLPDTLMYNAYQATMTQGRIEDVVKERLTDIVINAVARFQGIDAAAVEVTRDPVFSAFVDAYFSAEQTFLIRPREVFKKITSVDQLNSMLPGTVIEPLDDSPRQFTAPGNHYALTVNSGDRPVVFNLIVGKVEPPKACRLFLYSGDVFMEAEFLTVPTLSGTKASLIFIVNMPDEIKGTSLDAIAYAGEIDKVFQAGLDKAKKE